VYKPEIYAPGVNIMSTIPVPNNETENASQPLNRSKIFGSNSGTSMATPIVAGGIALILQKMRQNNRPFTIKDVKNELNSHGICSLNTAQKDERPGRLVFTNL
jgi:subtilisin family serine protease